MEPPKTEAPWAKAAVTTKRRDGYGRIPQHNAHKNLRSSGLTPGKKPPKCFIKITGSRYNGTFLLNIDDGLDDVIYRTMRDIEVALEEGDDPLGKSPVSPKNCLSSVFRCFGNNELQAKAVYQKRPGKSLKKPTQCSVTTRVNKTDLENLSSLINTVKSNVSVKSNSENETRDVINAFRTTLEKFRSLSEVDLTQTNLSKTQLEQDSNEQHKNVSIMFTQEEVLVIQPPKPTKSENKLEVGIEIKPKTAVEAVSQSIKLSKDKVLIGVQDGKGVLQIKEGTPKRSLHMIIEEGVNGKPAVKLSLNERSPDSTKNLTKIGSAVGSFNTHASSTTANPKYNKSDSLNHYKSGSRNCLKSDSLKCYKSVESQVSWERIPEPVLLLVEGSSDQLKTEATQYELLPRRHCSELKSQTTQMVNELSDISKASARDSPAQNPREYRINRLPFLVHTLYEPRSSDGPTWYAPEKPRRRYEMSKQFGTKRPKKNRFPFSSAPPSNRCPHIFRNMSEIDSKHSRNTSRMTSRNTSVEEVKFEKILKNICGPSYLSHHSHPHHPTQPSPPPPPPPPPPLQPVAEQDNTSNKIQLSAHILFDQWTQTIKEDKSQSQAKMTGCRSDDSTSPKVLKKQHKGKSSDTPDESSSSGLEEGLTSDSCQSNKRKPLFSVRDSPKLSPKTSNKLIRANSSFGKQLFAVSDEKKPRNTDNKHPRQSSSKARVKPGGNVTVNVALCEGPRGLALTKMDKLPLAEIPPCVKTVLKTGRNQCALQPRCFRSKSYQNFSLAPSHSTENTEWFFGRRNRKNGVWVPKLNSCGILNVRRGPMKEDTEALMMLRNPTISLQEALPTAIQSFLGPQRSSIYRDEPADDYNYEAPWDSWEDEVFDSRLSLNGSLIKRKLSTMKSVVSKKFGALFRKMSFTQLPKKSLNSTVGDIARYVPIPLTKKSESLNLSPRVK